jgi:hypothetical protein
VGQTEDRHLLTLEDAVRRCEDADDAGQGGPADFRSLRGCGCCGDHQFAGNFVGGLQHADRPVNRRTNR